MGDSYFQRLHELRNDAAKQSRESGKKEDIPQIVRGVDQGCESVHNDQREANEDAQKGCEAI